MNNLIYQKLNAKFNLLMELIYGNDIDSGMGTGFNAKFEALVEMRPLVNFLIGARQRQGGIRVPLIGPKHRSSIALVWLWGN